MTNETTNLFLVVSTSLLHAYIIYSFIWWAEEC